MKLEVTIYQRLRTTSIWFIAIILSRSNVIAQDGESLASSFLSGRWNPVSFYEKKSVLKSERSSQIGQFICSFFSKWAYLAYIVPSAKLFIEDVCSFVYLPRLDYLILSTAHRDLKVIQLSWNFISVHGRSSVTPMDEKTLTDA